MKKRWSSRGWICLGLFLALFPGCSAVGGTSGYARVFAPGTSRFNGSTWSPDGAWLAVESYDMNQFTLFSKNGQLVKTLNLGCALGNGDKDLAWLPDGRLSCFIGNEPPLLGLFTFDHNGQVKSKTTIPVPISPGTIVYAIQWNPHHDWLATISEYQPGSAMIRKLYLTDFQGHQLMEPIPVDSTEMSWSPDGTTLAIVQANGDIVLWKVQQQASGRLSLIRLRQLPAGTTADESVAWSPSGRWLVCRHRTYQSEDYLFLLATDGSGKQVKLTSSNTDGQLDYPAWSPDGTQLIVTRVSDGALLSLDIMTLLKDKGVTP